MRTTTTATTDIKAIIFIDKVTTPNLTHVYAEICDLLPSKSTIRCLEHSSGTGHKSMHTVNKMYAFKKWSSLDGYACPCISTIFCQKNIPVKATNEPILWVIRNEIYIKEITGRHGIRKCDPFPRRYFLRKCRREGGKQQQYHSPSNCLLYCHILSLKAICKLILIMQKYQLCYICHSWKSLILNIDK